MNLPDIPIEDREPEVPASAGATPDQHDGATTPTCPSEASSDRPEVTLHGEKPPVEAAARAPISAAKLAANRENAKLSTGPKTQEGKSRSAANSIKHGIFANKLFPETEAGLRERAEYAELAGQLREFYNPQGWNEQLLVERILIELVRSGRVLHFENEMLTRKDLFWNVAADRVLRYTSAHDRQLSRLVGELEEAQAKRLARQAESADLQNEPTEPKA